MTILYEDSQILVCYKEAGLPVQSARVGVKDLVSIVKNYLWERNGQREEPYLGVIHRLDQPVEGVLVFAKTPKAARELSAQVSDGRMKKIYHAVVWEPAEKYNTKEGTLADHLLTDKKTNSARVVPEGSKGAKQARLDYRILNNISVSPAPSLRGPEKNDSLILVEIHLHTGRHHQIRVQMANAGMPLCGDRKYGYPGETGQLALCAVSLELLHPATGKPMQFHCTPQGGYFGLFEENVFSGISVF